MGLKAVHGAHPRWYFTFEGRQMDRVGTAWKRALKRMGITNFRFHDLRHTWASWHVIQGTSLQDLIELGGWKSYEMVLQYVHLAPEQLADTVAQIEQRLAVVTHEATNSLS